MAILTNEAKQKLAQYRTYFLKVYPNKEQKPNPNFDPAQPEGESNRPTISYTDAEWVDEVVKRSLIQALKRGQQLIQMEQLQQDEFNDVA